MTATPVDKRNFYLSLSVADGQALANSVGFAIPSLEVQNHELVDTVQKWLTLAALGIIDQIRECTSWMAEAITQFQDLSEEDLANTKSVLTCYSVALLSYLIDNDYIDLGVQDNPVLDETRIDRLIQFLGAEEDILFVVDEDLDNDPFEEDDIDE
jgi:hypothetical protein